MLHLGAHKTKARHRFESSNLAHWPIAAEVEVEEEAHPNSEEPSHLELGQAGSRIRPEKGA